MNQNIRDLILKNDRLIELNTLIKLGVIKMEDAVAEVIAMGNASRIYAFARDIEGAPIVKLADAMIATYNESYIYEFAVYMQDKGLLNEELKVKFARAIIKTKSAQFICLYARDIKNAPLKELTEAEIAIGDAEYLYLYARNVDVVPTGLTEREAATKNAEYIYLYATNVKYASLEVLAEGMAVTEDAEYIYKFALYMQERNGGRLKAEFVAKFAKAIIATEDAKYIYLYARNIKGAPLKELAEVEIATMNAEYISYFICIEGAPVKKLIKGLVATRDTYYINEVISNFRYYVYPMIEKVEGIEKEVLAANDVMHYFWHYPQHTIAEIAEVEKEILATNDALFIYDCADKIAGIPVDNFIYKIIELQNFEVIVKMLENVRAGQKSKGQACIEIFALNHINLLLDTMKYCQDINLLRKTYVNVALPSIKNYIGNLISNLEDKSKIEVADVSVLEEEEKLNYLKMLYENGDFETIRKNRVAFSTLFQSNDEKITRK